MFRVGQVVILLLPGEFTTMAGRRIKYATENIWHQGIILILECREAIKTKLVASGVLDQDAIVLIAGPANTYGHYITTREEYGYDEITCLSYIRINPCRSVQRYEGGSTLYGPATLEAFVDIYSKLTDYVATSSKSSPSLGTPPPDLTKNPLSLRVCQCFHYVH